MSPYNHHFLLEVLWFRADFADFKKSSMFLVFLVEAVQDAVHGRKCLELGAGIGAQIPKALPSGKHTKNYGKSPCLMGKLTINGHFQ